MKTQDKCQQDQFQQAKEQVLTYTLIEPQQDMGISKLRKKRITKNLQRHKLQLIKDKQQINEFDIKEANKNIKKIQSSLGKIIPIGNCIFRSNFQCGNIEDVCLVASNTYSITLSKQTNSSRVSAWFYFCVEGLKGQNNFIIKGFTKSSSLYNQGMKVCYRQVKDHSKWRRGGSRIVYTNSVNIQQNDQQNSYELRFSHFFKCNQHTQVQFAYCFPYGLKKLYHLINNCKNNAKCFVLGKSYQKKDIPLLHIGNQLSDEVIIISARVHPGETVSSFIMQGFLKQLIGDSELSKYLRNTYLFKIIPMINVDGVFRGNYRFSAYGCDLNRKWKNCKQNIHPQIYYLRQLIRSTNRDKKVVGYIDLHGHSRKKHVFFYGCCQKGQTINPVPKQFPYLMQKIYDAFKFQNCCFAVQKDKQGTARVTVWKQLKIDFVYTLQSTFCSGSGSNYLQDDYEKIGKKLCQGLAIYFYDPNKKNSQQISSHYFSKYIQKYVNIKKNACSQLVNNPKLLQIGAQDNSGSDSQPQKGQNYEKQKNSERNYILSQKIMKFKQKKQKDKNKLDKSSKLLPFKSAKDLSQKFSSQILQRDDQGFLKFSTQQQKNNLKSHQLTLKTKQDEKKDLIQIKIASSINTYQLQSLKASSLFKKNTRVHSTTRNTDRVKQSVRQNTVQQIEITQRNGQKVKINLLQGKQGAQYRRVYKLAQLNNKKDSQSKIVQQLQSNQMNMSTHIHNNRSVAPRFYPNSQSKCRKISLDIKNKKLSKDFQKLSINGDQLSVRCFGKQVFI